MKLVWFAVILAISLTIVTVWSNVGVIETCDKMIYLLADEKDSDEFMAQWESFSKIVAFITPYDLIRDGDSNYRNYIALVESGADTSDIDAAREMMISSIRQIRRIHSLDWELIF